MSHHFSVFLSVLVQASRLAPVFLLVPGFRTGLESAFHLGMALPTVLEFRLELVPGFHLEMAPASRLDSGLPVSPLESDPLSVLAFPVLLAPLWKRHFHPEMVRTVLLLVVSVSCVSTAGTTASSVFPFSVSLCVAGASA